MILLRYWKPIVGALLVLAFVGAILAYGHRQYERGVADTKAELQSELERERELRRKADWKVRQDYETRIAELGAQAARERNRKPIRCVLGGSGEVRVGRDPSGPAEGAAGEPAVRAAPDIRSDIVRVGETCEQMRRQLLAIKQRQEALRAEAR